MTTTASRTKASSDRPELVYATFTTAWGWLGALAGPNGLTRLTMPKRTRAVARVGVVVPGAKIDTEAFASAIRQLQAYFAGRHPRFDLAIDLSALPPFTAAVLHAASSILYGQVATYGDLARQVGKPGASRAVGQAMGRNPVPIVVPCHRVISSTGLGGFSAEEGVDLKARLLAHEGALIG